VEPGDAAGLAAALRRLAEDFGAVEAAGARGYAAFQEFYDRPAGVGRICRIVEQVPKDAGELPVPA
jgi:hypothetical protein